MSEISNSSLKPFYLCTMVTGSTLFDLCIVLGIAFEIIFFHFTSLGFTIAWIGGSVSLGGVTLIIFGRFYSQFKSKQPPLYLQSQNIQGQLPLSLPQAKEILEVVIDDESEGLLEEEEAHEMVSFFEISKEHDERRKLPLELIEAITLYLTPKERVTVSLTNRGAYEALQNDDHYYLLRAKKVGYLGKILLKPKSITKPFYLG